MTLSSLTAASAGRALQPINQSEIKPQVQPFGAKGAVKALSNGDSLELSAAAKAKIRSAQSNLTRASEAQPSPRGAQESTAPLERYSRADVTDLLDQWGEAKGSEYDFDENGRVDSNDLSTLLARLGQPKPERESPAADDPFTRGDVDRLLEAWRNGSDPGDEVSARYDLDGDGQINGSDLSELLARLSGGG